MLFDKIKLMAQVIGFICIGLLAVYGGVVAATGGPPAWAAGDAAPNAPEAITPALISYQGTLRDDSDNLANGTYDMVVAICQNEDGSGQIWSETHNDVEVREGHFSLLLGEKTALSREDFVDPSLYIELTVDGQVMTPRQRFAAVPYAISATYATKLSAPDGDPAEAVWVSDDGDVHVGSSDQQSTMVALHGITPTLRFNHSAGQPEVDLRANGEAFEIIEPDDGDDLWLKINNDGQVGIGKDPEVKLDVNGWASVSGKLGVGTTSPDTDLSVVGVVRGADTADETDYTEIGHGGGNGYINTVGDGALKFRHDGDNKMSLSDAGDLNVTGNISWNGHLDDFAYSGAHTVSHDADSSGAGWSTEWLRATGHSICFLNGVKCRGAGGNDESCVCDIVIASDGGTNKWQLKAYAEDVNYTKCKARCIGW